MPMTVSGVDDALFGLMSEFTLDLAMRFHEVGARVEFQVRQ